VGKKGGKGGGKKVFRKLTEGRASLIEKKKEPPILPKGGGGKEMSCHGRIFWKKKKKGENYPVKGDNNVIKRPSFRDKKKILAVPSKGQG